MWCHSDDIIEEHDDGQLGLGYIQADRTDGNYNISFFSLHISL